MAKKQSKKKSTRTNRNKLPVKPTSKPAKPANQDPFALIMYHFVRIPWYVIKTFDWLFTVITAILVYLTK